MIGNLLSYVCVKNCRNRWSYDKAIAKIKRCSFLPHMVDLGAQLTRKCRSAPDFVLYFAVTKFKSFIHAGFIIGRATNVMRFQDWTIRPILGKHDLIITTDYHVALIETHSGRVVMFSLTKTKIKSADSEVVFSNHSQRKNILSKTVTKRNLKFWIQKLLIN